MTALAGTSKSHVLSLRSRHPVYRLAAILLHDKQRTGAFTGKTVARQDAVPCIRSWNVNILAHVILHVFQRMRYYLFQF